MFKAQNRHILIVDNLHLCWVATGGAERGACLHRLPLESLIGGAPDAPDLPEALKRSAPTLGIVPDHWFGSETFPFRSTKPALIEAFLSRKLSESHPNSPPSANSSTTSTWPKAIKPRCCMPDFSPSPVGIVFTRRCAG